MRRSTRSITLASPCVENLCRVMREFLLLGLSIRGSLGLYWVLFVRIVRSAAVTGSALPMMTLVRNEKKDVPG